MEDLLLELASASGRDYGSNLVNSQVVPSYEDLSVPAVKEYRQRMDEYGAKVPPPWDASDYRPLTYSFVSFEGFLNAKLLVKILTDLGPMPAKNRIKGTVENLRSFDLGIGEPISFGPKQHQGSDRVYYTAPRNGGFVPFANWDQWAK
jgi:hypothetical protein